MTRTPVPPRAARLALPLLAGAFAAGAYALTISPSIGPLHDTVDSAELVVVAAHLGVAHPPGSALWMPLGWAALTALPFVPEPALRTNLLSAALMAGAVVLLAVATLRWRPTTPSWAAALAGLLGGLAPITWAEAIVTEVLALQALLAALALVLVVDAGAGRRWVPFALVLGLLAWNHPTGLALAVPLGAAAVIRGRPPRRAWAAILAAFAAPAVYTVGYLLLRAGAPVSWGETGTLPGVWAHLTGAMYQEAIDLSAENLRAAVPASLRLALQQVPPPLWPLLPVGALALARERPLPAAALGTCAALLILWVAAYRATGHVDYLAPVVFIEAMLAAWGVARAWEWLRPRLPERSAVLAAAIVAAGLLAAWAAVVGTRVGLAGDTRLLDAARAHLEAAPPGGAVTAARDADLLPMWYAQAMLGVRPDVTIRSPSPLMPTLRGGVEVREGPAPR